jgi:hypothetical protein
MTKEETILNFMKSLDISREEAEQLYKDDHSETVCAEAAEMEKKAKSMGRRYENDKTADRKKPIKTPKLDEEKVSIVQFLANKLYWNGFCIDERWKQASDIKIVNSQREIRFKVGENDYSLVLTKHRNSKQSA